MGLRADIPIESIADDLCHWKEHASAIARLIHQRDQRQPFCLGVYGPWGSGKSSYVKMIGGLLQSMPGRGIANCSEPPMVMEFRPWIVSGQEQLVRYFLDELIGFLQEQPGSQRRNPLSVVADALYQYRDVLCDIASINFASDAAAKAVKGAMEQREKNKKQHSNLYELKKTVEQAFGKTKKNGSNQVLAQKHLVVVVEDIDRLLTTEMLAVFQLVKAVADFPNITYLLVYEQQMVLEALQEAQKGDPREYLEKMVQFSVPVPKIPPSALEKAFHQVLQDQWGKKTYQEFFAAAPALGSSAYGRWSEIWSYHIAKHLANFRNIHRFANLLSFLHAALGEELDPQDLSLWCWLCTQCPDLPHRVSKWHRIGSEETLDTVRNPKAESNQRREELARTVPNSVLGGLATLLPQWFSREDKEIRSIHSAESPSNSKSIREKNNLDRLLQFNSSVEEFWSPSEVEKQLNRCQSIGSTEVVWGSIPAEHRLEVLDDWSKLVKQGKTACDARSVAYYFICNGDDILKQVAMLSFSRYPDVVYEFIQILLLRLQQKENGSPTILYSLIKNAWDERPLCLEMPLRLADYSYQAHRKGLAAEFPVLPSGELEKIKEIIHKNTSNKYYYSTRYRPGLIVYLAYRLRDWDYQKVGIRLLENFASRSINDFFETLESFSMIGKGDGGLICEFQWDKLQEFSPKEWWQEQARNFLPQANSEQEEILEQFLQEQ